MAEKKPKVLGTLPVRQLGKAVLGHHSKMQ